MENRSSFPSDEIRSADAEFHQPYAVAKRYLAGGSVVGGSNGSHLSRLRSPSW